MSLITGIGVAAVVYFFLRLSWAVQDDLEAEHNRQLDCVDCQGVGESGPGERCYWCNGTGARQFEECI